MRYVVISAARACALLDPGLYRVTARNVVQQRYPSSCDKWRTFTGPAADAIRKTASRKPVSKAKLMKALRSLSACKPARGRARCFKGNAAEIWDAYVRDALIPLAVVRADTRWLIRRLPVATCTLPYCVEIPYYESRTGILSRAPGALINELLAASLEA